MNEPLWRKNLYDHRVFKLGMNLAEFSNFTGLSTNSLVLIENGKTKQLKTDTILKLKKALKLKPSKVHELVKMIPREESTHDN